MEKILPKTNSSLQTPYTVYSHLIITEDWDYYSQVQIRKLKHRMAK